MSFLDKINNFANTLNDYTASAFNDENILKVKTAVGYSDRLDNVILGYIQPTGLTKAVGLGNSFGVSESQCLIMFEDNGIAIIKINDVTGILSSLIKFVPVERIKSVRVMQKSRFSPNLILDIKYQHGRYLFHVPKSFRELDVHNPNLVNLNQLIQKY